MTIDPGAITLIQVTFLTHLNSAFNLVARYALNLLYLFAVLELVIFGLIWALQRDVGWDRLFFKVLKIGLIFFVIVNYGWLIDMIVKSFAQLAGVVVNDESLSQIVFNPGKLWQYGYDAGLNLLKLAALGNSFGLILIQLSLGLGILITFGLLGILLVVQIVAFYLVSFTALIMLPFGTFAPSKAMFDKAVQSVLRAGVRMMSLLIIIGVAATVWNGFQLVDLATSTAVNINQPLGLFFTSLLFLCLAYYLPSVAAKVVGNISGDFFGGAAQAPAPVVIREGAASPFVATPTGGMSDMQAATVIEGGPGAAFAGAGGGGAQISPASPASVSLVAPASGGGGRGIESELKETLAQASAMSQSISEQTIKSIKEAVVKAVKEK